MCCVGWRCCHGSAIRMHCCKDCGHAGLVGQQGLFLQILHASALHGDFMALMLVVALHAHQVRCAAAHLCCLQLQQRHITGMLCAYPLCVILHALCVRRFPQSLVITETFTLGRFGECSISSSQCTHATKTKLLLHDQLLWP